MLFSQAAASAATVGLGCGAGCGSSASAFLTTYVLSEGKNMRYALSQVAAFYIGKLLAVVAVCASGSVFGQSFVDESNTKTWIDDQYAYILPTGREKVVKVVLEGQTQIKDFENRDNSLEVYAWKKMGSAILTYHNWGIYQNTALAGHNESPYGF